MYSNESVESLRWIKRILTVFSLRILEQGRAYGEDGDGHGVHECGGLVGHVLPAVPLPVGEPDEFLYDLERRKIRLWLSSTPVILLQYGT